MTPFAKRSILHGLIVFGACAIALTLTFWIILSLIPELASAGTHRHRSGMILAIASGVILVIVPLADRLFRLTLGRRFPLEKEISIPESPPTLQKTCRRCSETYWVHANEHHSVGFCSRACREAYSKAGDRRP